MSTYVVSIGGRDAQGVALSDGRWEQYKREVLAVCENASPDLSVVFRGEGVGIWEGETEPSYTVILAGDIPELVDRVGFRNRLSRLARKNHQCSIAFTQGETDFVG